AEESLQTGSFAVFGFEDSSKGIADESAPTEQGHRRRSRLPQGHGNLVGAGNLVGYGNLVGAGYAGDGFTSRRHRRHVDDEAITHIVLCQAHVGL
ncbi:hypothetical protein CBX98_25750, partial [Vibrio sp. T9]|uniref:hypothetical protein n=1 Tax=Vibrio sp. T9 TaxID=2007196 RepID=UPI000D669B9E